MAANIDKLVISKLFGIKTYSKYLVRYLDKIIRPLVLMLIKISEYVNSFKVKVENNKLMTFCINDKRLLVKYKTI